MFLERYLQQNVHVIHSAVSAGRRTTDKRSANEIWNGLGMELSGAWPQSQPPHHPPGTLQVGGCPRHATAPDGSPSRLAAVTGRQNDPGIGRKVVFIPCWADGLSLSLHAPRRIVTTQQEQQARGRADAKHDWRSCRTAQGLARSQSRSVEAWGCAASPPPCHSGVLAAAHPLEHVRLVLQDARLTSDIPSCASATKSRLHGIVTGSHDRSA